MFLAIMYHMVQYGQTPDCGPVHRAGIFQNREIDQCGKSR
jgi:hypothetical protein